MSNFLHRKVFLSLIFSFASVANGAVTFYLSPGDDPDGDLPFQAALNCFPTEFDLDDLPEPSYVDTIIVAGAQTIDMYVLDTVGNRYTDYGVEIFYLKNFHQPGMIDDNTLLNRTYSGGDVFGAAIEFNFALPVEGFGTWILDDKVEVSQFVMRVTLTGGGTYTSSSLDSGNGIQVAVEGFMGAVSSIGIEKVVIEMQLLDGTISAGDAFYLDYLQVGGLIAAEDCADGMDNNGDGLVDCDDPQCRNNPGYPNCPETFCSDGLDNEQDGFIDCVDPDCFGRPGCTIEALCADDLDNDADGLVDCADGDCFDLVACPLAELCDDGWDNNFDGLIDCDDPDCQNDAYCLCRNDPFADADGDGDVDQSDFGLFQMCFSRQGQTVPEICGCFDRDNDGVGDGDIDQIDFAAFQICMSGPGNPADANCDGVSGGPGPWVWRFGEPRARLIAPNIAGPMEEIVQVTLNGYFAEAYGWTIPIETAPEQTELNIVVGTEANNPVLGDLVAQGLELDRSDLGDEGFQLLTHESENRRFVIVTANSPIGLKHGCQELAYFRMSATTIGAIVDWPMDVRMKPQFSYRGDYMLACWVPHDSVEHWRRVFRFDSELTLNRNWLWLAGFPLLPEYGGEYVGTDLADVDNVRSLIDLCRAQGMKFYIGGGWFTWHHEQIAGGSIERGIQYYLDMLALLPEAEGIFLEPVGEGGSPEESVWRQHTDALDQLASEIWLTRPDFEFSLVIGRFNPEAYRQAVHEIDQTRIFWDWGWGNPIIDNALAEHPLILRHHTINRSPSDWHGSIYPPQPNEIPLTGFATGYDSGQGFGNPWNGQRYGPIALNHPREFHPYTIPFFSHQYWFRERCWDINISEEQFAARLARRLFDANMPPQAISYYLTLADLCKAPPQATEEMLVPIDVLVSALADQGTPRNRDTLSRMREAVDGFRETRGKCKKEWPL